MATCNLNTSDSEIMISEQSDWSVVNGAHVRGCWMVPTCPVLC